jgi:hypothetical protein
VELQSASNRRHWFGAYGFPDKELTGRAYLCLRGALLSHRVDASVYRLNNGPGANVVVVVGHGPRPRGIETDLRTGGLPVRRVQLGAATKYELLERSLAARLSPPQRNGGLDP